MCTSHWEACECCSHGQGRLGVTNFELVQGQTKGHRVVTWYSHMGFGEETSDRSQYQAIQESGVVLLQWLSSWRGPEGIPFWNFEMHLCSPVLRVQTPIDRMPVCHCCCGWSSAQPDQKIDLILWRPSGSDRMYGKIHHALQLAGVSFWDNGAYAVVHHTVGPCMTLQWLIIVKCSTLRQCFEWLRTGVPLCIVNCRGKSVCLVAVLPRLILLTKVDTGASCKNLGMEQQCVRCWVRFWQLFMSNLKFHYQVKCTGMPGVHQSPPTPKLLRNNIVPESPCHGRCWQSHMHAFISITALALHKTWQWCPQPKPLLVMKYRLPSLICHPPQGMESPQQASSIK